MFFVRFVVLSLLVAYGWAMGKEPALNAFGNLVVASLLFTAPALYLLPTFEAWKNKHPNLTSIALVNVFLGWSLLGWVVAVVWAFKKPEPVAVAVPVATPAPPPAVVVSPAPASPVPMPAAADARATKRCPFCAEDVLVEAIKCKHCGSDLRAAAT